MPTYCVNKNAQPNGDHEVHDTSQYRTCLPHAANQVALGWHASCSDAIRAAEKAGFSPANGCYYCANECHTG